MDTYVYIWVDKGIYLFKWATIGRLGKILVYMGNYMCK